MTKILSLTACGTFAAYLVSVTTPHPWFPAPFAAFVCGFGTALVWDAIGTIVRRLNRPALDTAMISHRQCPNCLAAQSLEVTSDQVVFSPENVQYREVVLACINCDETYIVEATPKGES